MRIIGVVHRYERYKFFLFSSFPQGVHKSTLILGNSYTFQNTRRRFRLKSYMSCDSSNMSSFVIRAVKKILEKQVLITQNSEIESEYTGNT